MADKLVSVNDDYDFPAPVAARQAERLGDVTTAEGAALVDTISGATESLATKTQIPAMTGNARVRGMAAPTSTITPAPTFTAATANTLAIHKTPYWAGFRNFGAPLFDNGLGPTTGYARGPHRANASPYAIWDGSYGVDFDFDGQAFEWRMQAGANRFFRIWVDEVPHSLSPQATTEAVSGLTADSAYWFKVDFGSIRLRRIRLEFESWPAAPILFSGVRHAVTDTLLQPSLPSPRIMWITDSYGHGIAPGAEAPRKHETYPNITSKLLGFADAWTNLCVPSTGLRKPNASVPGLGTYRSRFASDVYPFKPDIIIIQGSINDTDSWPTYQGQVGPELITSINELRANLPNVKIIITSPLFAGNPSTSPNFSGGASGAVLSIRDEMKAACAAVGVPFIDALDAAMPVFTGSGQTGSPKGDGTADRYLSTDWTHANKAGYRLISHWLAGKIGPLLGQAN